ncbi:MAG: dTDP-glucose 4,6-dehydratase [Rhodospirillaceae bacterium]|nr:dTDP-glucose 4,6-dehydratase [Rhodospirillaceae bacterium]|tara:strand:+ start:211 stop:1206 length:996 start_codon:yes stop_codon:yes gene_type:complete
MYKILVIGSNSPSGASFIKKCITKSTDVIGISRSSEYDEVFLPYKWKPDYSDKFYRFIQIDLNKDRARLASLIRDFKPNYVVNFAAQSMVGESWDNPCHWYQTNVISNINLHNILLKCKSLAKYIHISTPEVYGNCSGVITENTIYSPSTPYATSRACCDMHLLNYFNTHNFPVVYTRAANVYGPGQQLYRIIPRTILNILLGKKLSLHGGGKSIRSFIYLEDVAEATWQIMLNGTPPSIYHLSTNEYISIKDLVLKICTYLECDFDSLVNITEDRPGKDAAYTLSSDKLRKDFDWSEKFSLEKGIQLTVEWVKNNLDKLEALPLNYIHKE